MFSSLYNYFYPPKEFTFRQELVKRLQDEGIDAEELLNKVKSTNSIIAGSYPLQIFLNETYDGSDLDIFTGNEEIINWLSNHTTNYTKSRSLNHDKALKRCGYGSKFMNFNEYITKTEFKIQVIHDPSFQENIAHNVFRRFDFDFCKIGYDGQNLHIDNEDVIKNKTCRFNPEFNQVCRKSHGRLLKYEKRGFKILNRDDLIKYIRCVCEPDDGVFWR